MNVKYQTFSQKQIGFVSRSSQKKVLKDRLQAEMEWAQMGGLIEEGMKNEGRSEVNGQMQVNIACIKE